jgi:flagellar hook-associated protein 1
MITPGFFGFFNAQRGLLAAQNALSTINHNISNANTPGYTRQRVELSAYDAYTFPTSNQSSPLQIGQGPQVDDVIRIRDQFLDSQFRSSNGDLGRSQMMRDTLKSVEGVLNEPSVSSINNSLQNFFDAAQVLSLQPDSTAARSNFIQQGIDVTKVFQGQALELDALRRNLVGDPLVSGSLNTSQLAIQVKDINTTLDSIVSINQNIVGIKTAGAEPNDLYDQRDALLDKLSQLVDTDVTYLQNGQINLSIAGQAMIRSGAKVNSLNVITNPGPIPTPDDLPALVVTTTSPVQTLTDGLGTDEITSGKIRGLIELAGNDPTLSTIRGVLGQLDTLINSIVTQVNTLQTSGRDQSGGATPPAFFVNNPALNPGKSLNIFHLEVNSAVVANPGLLAAAINDPTVTGGFAGKGDGRNALAMAQIRDNGLVALGGSSTLEYLNALVSKIGIDTRSYQDITTTQTSQTNTISNQRQAVSGVNIDEETIDLLRYQRAFEATSKTISILDEVMQTIINLV